MSAIAARYARAWLDGVPRETLRAHPVWPTLAIGCVLVGVVVFSLTRNFISAGSQIGVGVVFALEIVAIGVLIPLLPLSARRLRARAMHKILVANRPALGSVEERATGGC